MAAGLIPEANIDAAVSTSQLWYDLNRSAGVKDGGGVVFYVNSGEGLGDVLRQIFLNDWW